MGHYARKCPNKINGTRTDSKEVNAVSGSSNMRYSSSRAQVKTGTNTASTSTNVLNIQAQQKDTHLKYFKDACINGRSLNCYVDLGSSCITIRDDIAKDMGFLYYECESDPLIGYGQGIVKPLGLFTCTLSIDDVKATVTIHVVPKESQEVPLIVGHPYTEHKHVVITSRADRLVIEEVYDTPEAVVQSKTVLRSTKTTVIPDNYIGHIQVKSDLTNYELCVEGGIHEMGQAIPRCLIKTDCEGQSALQVMNVSGKDWVIQEGKVVTRGEICEEVKYKTNSAGFVRELNTKDIEADEIQTELSGTDLDKVLNLLNEYKDVVARNMRQLGVTDQIEMKVRSYK